MTTPSAESMEATTPPAKPAPLWEDFIDIFYAPSQVFARRQNSNPWPMLLIITALWLVISLVTFDSMATVMETMMRRGMEKAAAQNPQLTQDMLETQLRVSMKVAPWFPIGLPLAALVGALVFWLVGKIFGSKASYTQSLVVITYASFTFVVGALVAGVIALLMDTTKMTNPYQLSLGPARFFDPAQTSSFLYGLLLTLDPFSIWRVVLVTIGMYVIGKTSKNAAILFGVVVFAISLLMSIRTAISMQA